MVKKKKTKHVLRPWCWYCERDFEDEKVLMQHQKAKHFKCGHCPRKLNTAGGLAVHIQQVHKLDPEPIENAIAGRSGYEVEIFGMEGIPVADVAIYKRKKEQEIGLPVGYFGNKAGDPAKANQTKRNYENRIYTFEELTSLLETHKQLMGREDENAKMETEASGPVLHAAPQTYNLPPAMSGIPSLPGLPPLPGLTTIPPGHMGLPGPMPGMPGMSGLPGMPPPISMTGPPGAPPLSLPFPPMPGMPFPPFPPGMFPPGGPPFPGLPPPSALAAGTKAGEGASPTPPLGELPKGFPGLPGVPSFGMPPGFPGPPPGMLGFPPGPNAPGGAGGHNISGLPGIPGGPPQVSKLPTGMSSASTSPSKKPMMGSRPANIPNAPAAPFDPIAAGLKEGTVLKWTDMNYSPLERRAEDPKYSQPSGTAGDGDVDMADSTTIGRKRARAEDFLD